jgi:hypothetical protein
VIGGSPASGVTTADSSRSGPARSARDAAHGARCAIASQRAGPGRRVWEGVVPGTCLAAWSPQIRLQPEDGRVVCDHVRWRDRSAVGRG